jgi:phage terminase small subunit
MSKRKPGSTLTDKEKMFCEEYIVDLDAARAAIKAGYSEESAASAGYHVRQRPEVAAYINKLLDDRSLRLRITADQVLLELAKIGFAEIVDTTEGDAPEEANNTVSEAPPPPKESLRTGAVNPETVMPAKTSATKAKAGTPKYTAASLCRVIHIDPETGRRTITWFSLQSKIAALKLLGKHLGLFEKHNALLSKFADIDVIYPGQPEDEQDDK